MTKVATASALGTGLLWAADPAEDGVAWPRWCSKRRPPTSRRSGASPAARARGDGRVDPSRRGAGSVVAVPVGQVIQEHRLPPERMAAIRGWLHAPAPRSGSGLLSRGTAGTPRGDRPGRPMGRLPAHRPGRPPDPKGCRPAGSRSPTRRTCAQGGRTSSIGRRVGDTCTYRCSDATSGNSAATSSKTLRKNANDRRMFALSTQVTQGLGRPPRRLRQAERGADDSLGPAAGDHLRVGGDLIPKQRPAAERGEDSLGALADDDEVDRRRARERPRDPLRAVASRGIGSRRTGRA